MSFNSIQFLIFLPIVIFGYFILPHKVRWIFLLIASYYFYMSWNPWLIFLIVSTTLVSYLSGIFMEKTENRKVKKALLILTLVVCLGFLFFFKYFNFLLANVIAFLNLFSMHIDSVALDIILPIGISFYTFQTLSYVIDVYKGKYKAEKHFGYYALFVSFFPQLVAGPIERPDILIPQLKAEHKLNADDFFCGLRILLCGFFYKCVVADMVGVYVNNVYNNIGEATSLSVFLAGLLFAIQIYGDFNGYSEIAIGCSRMMGIKLSRNFDRPYLSLTFGEFFRRWHITLNTWFTDYLYIPLGGSRKGKVRRIINTLIVFALCGLWHGANWTYVIWGLYSGVFACLEYLLRKPVGNFFAKRNIDVTTPTWKMVRRCALFLVYVPACLIFRASSLSQVGELFAKLFTGFTPLGSFVSSSFTSLGMTGISFIFCLLIAISMDFVFRFGEIGRLTPDTLYVDGKITSYSRFALRALVCCVLIFVCVYCTISLLSSGGTSQFVYFQF